MKYFFLAIIVSALAGNVVAQSVGIGTSTPNNSAQLEVVSTTKGVLIPRMTSAQRTAIAAPAAGLMVYETSSNSFWFYNGTAWGQIGSGAASGSWTVNGTHIYSNNTGNVGIGAIATPTERLDVLGSIRSRDTIRADNDLEAGVDIRAGGDMVATGIVRGSGFASTGNMLLSGNATVVGAVESFTELVVDDVSATLRLQAGNTDKGFVQLSGDNLRIGTYGTNTTGKLVMRTGGSDHVTLDETGKMGYGIADPLAKIQVVNGSDVSLTTHGYMMLGAVTGNNVIFDSNEIMARNNGTASSLVLQNDGGSVRIGSVAVPAGYKFAINGKMICEEVKVKLASGGWPDYVFADNYDLKPLSQVEQFIEQNGHLPNIPSAAQLEKNGLEVGDMQKRMMEKIEELTLYIIQLEKKVNAMVASTVK